MNKHFFSGKRVLVMGLGRFGGGVDAAKFAAAAGAKVTVTDLAPEAQLSDSVDRLKEFADIKFHLGSHDAADFQQADIVIANPAVALDNEFLELARRHDKIITSQIEIFFQLCPAVIIGITGANGKSTVTALTAHLLRSASDEHVWLSGNIGNEPLLMTIDQIGPNDLVVLELSSFQLDQLAQIQRAPQVALLTNLTPNHLDRYHTFEDYCAAKENVFKFQTLNKNCPAVSIFNAEDEIATQWFEKYRKQAGRICIRFSAEDVSPGVRDSFTLPGRSNLSNLAAALAVARHFGTNDEQIKSCLPHFKPLPHRLELIRQINGVRWYNDSKATTPQSATAALDAFAQPVILIAGGYDKHLPFDEFGRKIAQKGKAAILIGQTAPKISEAINNAKMSLRAQRSNVEERWTRDDRQGTKIATASSLADAVQLASRFAEPGDVVLLSPACASYDMFENYEHRGRTFIRLVQALRS